jgi:predicted aspartyl protease
MSTPFAPAARSVLIPITLFGSRAGHVFQFMIDTGATRTCIRPELLRRLGIDPDRPVSQIRIRSATGGGNASLFRVARVVALGQTRTDFPIAAQDLPLSVAADGLLGLDFYRGLILRLDFAHGRASLAPPSWWRFWR